MMNFMQILPMFNNFKQNPMAFLASRGLNIPQQYMQTPEMAARYLMNQSNMSQDQINNAMNTASQFQSFMNNQGTQNRF